mgnify:FL=1
MTNKTKQALNYLQESIRLAGISVKFGLVPQEEQLYLVYLLDGISHGYTEEITGKSDLEIIQHAAAGVMRAYLVLMNTSVSVE